MSSRRTLILIGALLVGGMAAFLTLNYVRGVENRVDEDSAMVPVVVAAAPIAKGDNAAEAIAAQNLVVEKRPRHDVPATAVTRLADVDGQVAAIDLGGGEMVTSKMFGSTAELTGSKSAALDDGNVAITVSVDSASVSGGLIQPGDLVNLLVRYTRASSGGAAGQGGDSGASGDPLVTKGGGGAELNKPASYVMQAVKVFAVGTNAGTAVAKTTEKPADGAAAAPAEAISTFLTVQLPPAQAALLASVRDAELYATLVPPDYKPQPIPLVTDLPALPGELGQTPYSEATPGQ